MTPQWCSYLHDGLITQRLACVIGRGRKLQPCEFSLAKLFPREFVVNPVSFGQPGEFDGSLVNHAISICKRYTSLIVIKTELGIDVKHIYAGITILKV